MINVIPQARDIQRQTGESWSVCMVWAHQCHAEYLARKEAQDDLRRASFRAQRLEEIRCEKFLDRLRSAPIMKDNGTHNAVDNYGDRPAAYKAEARPHCQDEPLHKMVS